MSREGEESAKLNQRKITDKEPVPSVAPRGDAFNTCLPSTYVPALVWLHQVLHGDGHVSGSEPRARRTAWREQTRPASTGPWSMACEPSGPFWRSPSPPREMRVCIHPATRHYLIEQCLLWITWGGRWRIEHRNQARATCLPSAVASRTNHLPMVCAEATSLSTVHWAREPIQTAWQRSAPVYQECELQSGPVCCSVRVAGGDWPTPHCSPPCALSIILTKE